MKFPNFAILALLSFLLAFSSIAESRKDAAGEYWRNVMKDQPVPKAIQGLVVHDHSDSVPKNSNEKANSCHHGTSQNSFTDDFEPTPNVSAYPDAQNSFTDDFEPTPNILLYPDDTNIDAKPEGIFTKEFAEDFKPGPQASKYNE